MESYLNENFGDVKPKNSSEQALQRWRKLRGLLKNRKRRFRFTSNLAQTSKAEAILRPKQVNDTVEDDNHSTVISSSPGSEYFSCTDTERSETQNGDCEAHQRRDGSFKKVILKWIFVIANFICEVLSVIFDQLSSPQASQYALIALLISFANIVICITEMVYKGHQEKVTWRMRGKLYWCYHPPPSHKPFGTFKDIFGLVCAIFQFISSAISYGFYTLHVNSPKISLCSLLFAFCLLCSNFYNDQGKVAVS